ncbi:MAG TPA: hypothetical protein VGC90_03680 [Candidatus Limnocylindrales bacterium]|jgi:hypothetical protein
MTASFGDRGEGSRGVAADVAANIVIGIIGGVVVFGLGTAGLTFLALAIAFPIAVPVAQQFHAVVSVADVAIAEQLARYWWVFAGFGVASFIAAGVVAIKVVDRVSPPRRG